MLDNEPYVIEAIEGEIDGFKQDELIWFKKNGIEDLMKYDPRWDDPTKGIIYGRAEITIKQFLDLEPVNY